MSKGNVKPFEIMVRGDGDYVFYHTPLSDSEFDRIQDQCGGDIRCITRLCIALCRKKGVDVTLSRPLIDIPAYMGFEELRIDSESQL